MTSTRRSAPRGRQILTVTLLLVGYAGYYLCRSDLSVALPLLIRELGARGVSENDATLQFGSIASLGVLAYAIGKFPNGWLADVLGGRRNFLFGMAGSIVFTVAFGLAGGVPLFTLTWIGNRLVQSCGWAGVVKIISKWFSYSTYGTVMGVIILSFLFGDAASRKFMAILLDHGLGWRGVFGVAAATLACCAPRMRSGCASRLRSWGSKNHKTTLQIFSRISSKKRTSRTRLPVLANSC